MEAAQSILSDQSHTISQLESQPKNLAKDFSLEIDKLLEEATTSGLLSIERQLEAGAQNEKLLTKDL